MDRTVISGFIRAGREIDLDAFGAHGAAAFYALGFNPVCFVLPSAWNEDSFVSTKRTGHCLDLGQGCELPYGTSLKHRHHTGATLAGIKFREAYSGQVGSECATSFCFNKLY
jgi:hypothetical protein